MPSDVAVGFTLQPDDEFLGLLDPLLRSRAVDYFEITPETTWWSPDEEPGRLRLLPNGFHERFLLLGKMADKAFVGHGVGLSLGNASRSDLSRRRKWLERLRQDQACFSFRWYTEHLGMSAPLGQALALPLPLLMDAASVARVARRLLLLRAFLPEVGVENTAQYFLLGDALDEPRFLRRLLHKARGHLLLDLHNLHTMAENLDFDAEAYLARLDLAQVIELHLSGGSYSDGAWLPSGRVLRLDSHDGAVPKPVWRLFESVLPRCPNLRGVTLERMEGTVSAADVPRLAEELGRIRFTLANQGRA
jgi:uncharacterized protein (UPF0276 family)